MRTKSDILKEEIVKIATEEFLINGFQNTSLRKIAKRLNKTTGAIYIYFESKEQLFAEVVSKEFFGFLVKMENEEFAKLSFEDKLLKMVDYSFQPLKRIVKEYGVNRTMDFLMVTADLAHKESQRKNKELDLRMKNTIKNIFSSEVTNKNVDIDTLAIHIILVIDGALINSLFLFDSLEEAEDNCNKVVLQLLKLIK